METEEMGVEFQEKVGLKRKLTGPPRLLLGKTKSPVQDEKKSDAQALRKQRRDKNNGTPKHTVEEHQGNSDAGGESHQVTCQSPQTAFAVEEQETHTDPQEESLEAESKSEQSRVEGQHGKSRLRRSRAKATIRRMFSPAFTCLRRRKQLDTKSVEDAEDNATRRAQISLEGPSPEPLTLSGDSCSVTERCRITLPKKGGTRKGKRKLHVGMWPIFKRRSTTSRSNQKHEKSCPSQDKDTFIEITSEKSVERSSPAVDQSDYCAPEPSGDEAVAGQLKGSSETQRDMAGIHEESCPGHNLDPKEEGTEKVTLSAEVNTDFIHKQVEQAHSPEQDVHISRLSNIKDEEDTNIQIAKISEPGGLSDPETTATCIPECNSDMMDPDASPDITTTTSMVVLNDLDKLVNDVKCKPVIKIEDVHSSDEEIPEPVENDIPRCNPLSQLLSVNGSCHRFQVNRGLKNSLQTLDHSDSSGQLSEILLVQTAFSLVHAAINSAMEQLSAELQSNQIDQDHA